MQTNILILDGHPDPAGGHFIQALADAYAAGAQDAGHSVRRIRIAELDFPLLRSKADWDAQGCPAGLAEAHAALLYRWYFGAHSVRSLERNILGFVGVAPVRRTLIGMVEGPAHKRRAQLEAMRACGQAAR